jgi:arsenate reductase
MIHFYCKKTCGTCKKAREWLTSHGVEFEEIDLIKNPLSKDELEKIIGTDDISNYLNPRSKPYREHKMKLTKPDRETAIQIMAEDPNLIKRPVIFKNGEVSFGFNEKVYEEKFL